MPSKNHLKDHGHISYGSHLNISIHFAWSCLKAAGMAFVHGVWPSFFSKDKNAVQVVRDLLKKI